jgi:branched-chain amino acid transport system ATP-binding protein
VSAPLLAVDGLTLRFGGLAALQDVGFEMAPGTILGVVGPNGAGKTALLNCVCGVYRPQEGSILLDGVEIRGRRPEAVAALGVGRTFQGMDHFNDFLVGDYVMLGRSPRLSRSTVGSAVRWPSTERRERRERAAVRDVLAHCGLADYEHERLDEVPYGIQKQVDVARVIASDCRLALLDEPTSGTTSSERRIISRSIELLVDRDIAVVLIDHDVPFVTQHCRQLLALGSGQVLAAGPTADVLADAGVREAFLGLAV